MNCFYSMLKNSDNELIRLLYNVKLTIYIKSLYEIEITRVITWRNQQIF